MRHLAIYLIGLICVGAPAMAHAHAQLGLHHHGDGGNWISLLPEILLITASIAGVLFLFNRLKNR